MNLHPPPTTPHPITSCLNNAPTTRLYSHLIITMTMYTITISLTLHSSILILIPTLKPGYSVKVSDLLPGQQSPPPRLPPRALLHQVMASSNPQLRSL